MRFFLCLSLLLASCASRVTRLDTKVEKKPVIVLVPGFYGTALADAETKERYFISTWQSLFSEQPLALHEPDLGVPGARKLETDGVLRNIPIVPLFYAYDAYGVAIDFLGGFADVVPFAYDWRQDLHQTVLALDRLVDSLEKSKAAPIVLVGHSMGGLIVSWYLRYGTEPPETARENDLGARRVTAAVVAATPFNGAVTAFRNLQTGTSLGTAETPLDQISLSTMPAMYYLIPGGGDAYRGRPVGERIRRLDLWEKNGWGLLKDRYAPPEVLERRKKAQAQYLSRAEFFLQRLHAPHDGAKRKDPQILHLAGNGHETFDHVVWEVDHWNWKTTPGDGDNLVPVSSSKLPEGMFKRFRAKSLATRFEHGAVFGSEACRKAITEFLEPVYGAKKR